MSQLNIGGDFSVFDGTEAVTYNSKIADGQYASGVAVSTALRRQPDRDEIAARSLLGKTTVHWNIWKAQLPGVEPKIHDTVTDTEGFVWQVISIEIDTGITRYKLLCTRSH